MYAMLDFCLNNGLAYCNRYIDINVQFLIVQKLSRMPKNDTIAEL